MQDVFDSFPRVKDLITHKICSFHYVTDAIVYFAKGDFHSLKSI